jgi:Pyridine nucleotide-disulphide oxidoreductase
MQNTVVIGAGPYGLSLATGLRRKGIPFRIFGRPMDSWLRHMPRGMVLKSGGFASSIYDPESSFTLLRFCAERGIEYSDADGVRLETFSEYGLAFRDRMVPETEDKLVVNVERAAKGFVVKLDDGETVEAQHVVLAVGITHFGYVPDNLAHLPEKYLSHSACHSEPSSLRGKSVVVVGAGSSALDLAGLMHEAQVDVQLVARTQSLKFQGKPTGQPRTWWERLQYPESGLGPGWRSLFYSDAPNLFYYLPEKRRLELVRRVLGPCGGWSIKEKVVGKVPAHLGQSVLGAEVRDDKVRLRLRGKDGSETEIVADHVIAATGYRVSMERLSFLSPAIRSNLRVVEGTPVLSSSFESSIGGLYFVGLAAANSFGPVMRFLAGAGFTANRVATRIAKDRRLPAADFAVQEEYVEN